MLSILYGYCPTPDHSDNSCSGKFRNTTKWTMHVLDTLGGVTLVVIGLLGSMGMIAGLTTAASWAMIGAGAAYGGIAFMKWIQDYLQAYPPCK